MGKIQICISVPLKDHTYLSMCDLLEHTRGHLALEGYYCTLKLIQFLLLQKRKNIIR